MSVSKPISKIKDGEARIIRNRQQAEELEENSGPWKWIRSSFKRELDEEEQSIRTNNTDLDQLTDRLNKASEAFNEANIEVIRQQNLLTNHLKTAMILKQSRMAEISDRINPKPTVREADILELEQAENHKLDWKISSFLFITKNTFQSALNANEQNYFSARNIISGLEEEIRVLNRSSINTRLRSIS